MKKIIYFLIPLFLLIFSTSYNAVAQANTSWTALLLDVAGRTVVGGVEVFAQVDKCNNEDVVYLKIVNNNEHKVKVEWIDAVRTKELLWVKKEDPADQRSITIEPNKLAKGVCGSDNYTECVIKLKNFIDSQSNFKEYAVYHFNVIAVMK